MSNAEGNSELGHGAHPDEKLQETSESLANIKEKLISNGVIEGTYGAPEIEGVKIEKIYDTGNEPETGTTRTDDAIIKITESDGTISFAQVLYYHRDHTVHEVTFMGEAEANAFMENSRAEFKGQ